MSSEKWMVISDTKLSKVIETFEKVKLEIHETYTKYELLPDHLNHTPGFRHASLAAKGGRKNIHLWSRYTSALARYRKKVAITKKFFL